MKFSTLALAAAVFASVVNGFAGPQVTPRFALQVRSKNDPRISRVTTTQAIVCSPSVGFGSFSPAVQFAYLM